MKTSNLNCNSHIADIALQRLLTRVGHSCDTLRGFDVFEPTNKQWSEVVNFFENTCCYCGVTLSPSSAAQDYLVPLNKENLGLHAWGNVVPSCSQCCKLKGDGSWRNFLQKRSGGKDYANREQRIHTFLEKYRCKPTPQLAIVADHFHETVAAVTATLLDQHCSQSHELLSDALARGEIPRSNQCHPQEATLRHRFADRHWCWFYPEVVEHFDKMEQDEEAAEKQTLELSSLQSKIAATAKDPNWQKRAGSSPAAVTYHRQIERLTLAIAEDLKEESTFEERERDFYYVLENYAQYGHCLPAYSEAAFCNANAFFVSQSRTAFEHLIDNANDDKTLKPPYVKMVDLVNPEVVELWDKKGINLEKLLLNIVVDDVWTLLELSGYWDAH